MKTRENPTCCTCGVKLTWLNCTMKKNGHLCSYCKPCNSIRTNNYRKIRHINNQYVPRPENTYGNRFRDPTPEEIEARKPKFNVIASPDDSWKYATQAGVII